MVGGLEVANSSPVAAVSGHVASVNTHVRAYTFFVGVITSLELNVTRLAAGGTSFDDAVTRLLSVVRPQHLEVS